jgi:Ca2+-binding EF-hand superfamily protein
VADDTEQKGSRNDEGAVTKSQLLHFFEVKFQLADRDHDGQLSVTELSNFLRFVTHPDLRSIRSWDRFG